MARQSNNHIMRGTRGMIGKQVVFKIRKGTRIVAAPPSFDRKHTPTANQQTTRERFKRATDYANEAIRHDHVKAAYQKAANKRQSAQNMAFRDAYYPPQIRTIITQGYTGAIGNIIVVHAVDDFTVTSVKVSILNNDGSVIEMGEAVTDEHRTLWVYTVTVANTTTIGCTIKVSAFDLPENETVKEVAV